MKELETHFNVGVDSESRTEINIKKKQEIEYILEGRLSPKKGHFIWQINTVTLEVKKADYQRNTIGFMVDVLPEELITKKDCIYIPALNKKNALAKYNQNNRQSHYYIKEPPMSLSDIRF